MATSIAQLPSVSADVGRLVSLVMDSVTSPYSKRVYRRGILDFIAWFEKNASGPLTKAIVQEYRSHLEAGGLSATTINVRLPRSGSWPWRPPTTAS